MKGLFQKDASCMCISTVRYSCQFADQSGTIVTPAIWTVYACVFYRLTSVVLNYQTAWSTMWESLLHPYRYSDRFSRKSLAVLHQALRQAGIPFTRSIVPRWALTVHAGPGKRRSNQFVETSPRRLIFGFAARPTSSKVVTEQILCLQQHLAALHGQSREKTPHPEQATAHSAKTPCAASYRLHPSNQPTTKAWN